MRSREFRSGGILISFVHISSPFEACQMFCQSVVPFRSSQEIQEYLDYMARKLDSLGRLLEV